LKLTFEIKILHIVIPEKLISMTAMCRYGWSKAAEPGRALVAKVFYLADM
jgi:hypothetical protein